MPKLTVRVYADDLLLRETDDERAVAAVMSFIAKNPLPSNKHPLPTNLSGPLIINTSRGPVSIVEGNQTQNSLKKPSYDSWIANGGDPKEWIDLPSKTQE